MGRDWESLAVKSLHPYGIWIRRHRIGKNVLEDGPCNFVGRWSLCQCERKKEREREKLAEWTNSLSLPKK